MNMETRLRRIVTPDMVSLWIPSGTDRARDIIRGNHGKVIGAHSNVPVLSSLINPSVGWHFGGDDYVDCGNDKSLTPAHITAGAWIYLEDVGSNKHIVTHNENVISEGYMLGTNERKVRWTLNNDWGGDGDLQTTDLIPLYQWARILGTYDGSKMKIFINGEINVETDYSTAIDYTTILKTMIGVSYQGDQYFFNGYGVLPFIAKGAWSVAQAKNDYLNTKGLFAPRG